MSKTAKIALGLLSLILLLFPLWANPYIVQVAIIWITYSALGLAFVFSLRVGLPRIDIVTWWGIGGLTTALLMNAGLNFFLAALIAGLISMVLGYIIFSFIVPRGAVIFFTFCVFFFLFAPHLIRFLYIIPFLRGAGGEIGAITLGPLEFISKPSLYYLGLFFMGINITTFSLLYRSAIGRAWNAINSSTQLAHSVGVNVVRYRIANMAIGNFFISLAGSYLIAYNHLTPPVMFSLQAGGMVMMYAFIGGLSHSFWGPVLGAFLLTFVPEYFRVAKEYEPIVTSVLTILIIIFMPAGILGWIDNKITPRLRRLKWFQHSNRPGVKGLTPTIPQNQESD
jgi:branched-chain amino acid transport system permease protein